MNKKITRLFLESLMKKINEELSYKVYYEEAPNNALFPYGVIPTLSINSLDYGYNCILDIEIYVNELSEKNVEDLCDELRILLDGYSFYKDGFGFHINYDTQILSKSNEQDLTYRRITFIARIF